MSSRVHAESIEGIDHFRGTWLQSAHDVEQCLRSAEDHARQVLEAIEREASRLRKKMGSTDEDARERREHAVTQSRLIELDGARRRLAEALAVFNTRSTIVLTWLESHVAEGAIVLRGHVSRLEAYATIRWSHSGGGLIPLFSPLSPQYSYTTGGLGLPYRPDFSSVSPVASFSTVSRHGLNSASSYAPHWATRSGDRMILGFSSSAPIGAMPYLNSSPTGTSSYMSLQLGSDSQWRTPLGFGSVSRSYDVSFASGGGLPQVAPAGPSLASGGANTLSSSHFGSTNLGVSPLDAGRFLEQQPSIGFSPAVGNSLGPTPMIGS